MSTVCQFVSLVPWFTQTTYCFDTISILSIFLCNSTWLLFQTSWRSRSCLWTTRWWSDLQIAISRIFFASVLFPSNRTQIKHSRPPVLDDDPFLKENKQWYPHLCVFIVFTVCWARGKTWRWSQIPSLLRSCLIHHAGHAANISVPISPGLPISDSDSDFLSCLICSPLWVPYDFLTGRLDW